MVLGSCGSFSMVIFQSPGVTTVSSWCSKTRELHGFFRGSAVSDIVLWNRMMSYSQEQSSRFIQRRSYKLERGGVRSDDERSSRGGGNPDWRGEGDDERIQGSSGVSDNERTSPEAKDDDDEMRRR
ncbi:hypothetical protein F2Q70_00012854 [Brassica cretica]|uniref:Uncharacterized protein n=1 Tax=Brassica cretica TaxID=69181 RepID=A0A8S9LSX7_BRACR|nr:hypothetical protein F2Q70_00012854 [Brassica cretica]